MGIIQCTTGKDKNNIWNLIEKSINNKKSTLDKKIFEFEGKIDENMIKVGASVPMQNEQGHPLNGLILEIGESTIKMDFNHPLAGQGLYFTGEVVEVREATSEEIEHGHVHGDGGHQH